MHPHLGEVCPQGLGIRRFKPELRRAATKLVGQRTPEDQPSPTNTLDEVRRDMARLAMAREQIGLIEQARLTRSAQAPSPGSGTLPPA
jgi:transposase